MNEKKYSVFSNYIYVYRKVWDYKKSLIFQQLAEVVFNALIPLALTLLPAMIVSLLEQGSNANQLILACIGVFGATTLLQYLASYFKNKGYYAYIGFRCTQFWPMDLQKEMASNYAAWESDEYKEIGDLAHHALSANHWGVEGIIHDATTFLTNLLGLIFYCFILGQVNFWIVGMLLLLSLIQYLFYRVARNYEEKTRKKVGDLDRKMRYFNRQAYDATSGKDVRIYQGQHWLSSHQDKLIHAYKQVIGKQRSFYYMYDVACIVLSIIRDGACYLYLITQLSHGLSLAEFVLYLGIVAGFGTWFSQLSDIIAKIGRDAKMVSDARTFFDYDFNPKQTCSQVLNPSEEDTFDIEFEDVCFHYPKSEQLILDHVSFHLNKGDKLALVGLNGAGKTTLVKLLCGLYQPTSGTIRINGKNLADLNVQEYFKHLAVLFQDASTMSFTIAENISCTSYEETDMKRLEEALKKADLWDKVQSLPKKEKTYLNKDMDDEGINLSGGQYQRLILARALYKNANLLILDEPTAALDALAESEMYEKYNELVDNKTSIFISHRLSSTKFCNHIFYLENGKIEEEGTHDELLKLNGKYAEIFEAQSKYYVEGEENYEL